MFVYENYELDNMNPQQIEAMVQKIVTDKATQVVNTILRQSQYNNSPVPDHAHDGGGSNRIKFSDLAGGLTVGTAAPTITPASVGQIFINTTLGKVYIATNTTNNAGWAILN